MVPLTGKLVGGSNGEVLGVPYAYAGQDVPVTVPEARIGELESGAPQQCVAATLIAPAGRLAAANQGTGGSDTNLTAIAAAVIGGTSLFGGRGNAWSAVLGALVIHSISSGLTLLNLDSSIRYMVTGVVLALAVTIDAVSRRTRPLPAR